VTDSDLPSSTPPPPPPAAPPPSSPPPSSSVQGTPTGPTPTTPGAERKGTSPLVWVAVGCGCLVILAGISTLFLGGYLVKKAGKAISDIAEDPVMATAERAVEASPELELVSSNREKGRLEIRDKKTGETYWFDASDIAKGQISFGKGDEARTVTFGGEEGRGTVRFEGPEGESEFRVGSGAGGEIPDWLPIPKGAEVGEGVFSLDTPESRSGSATLVTDDSVDDVVAFYRKALEGDGWKVSRATYSGDMGEGATLNATSADGKRTLILGIARKDDHTTVGIYHSGEE
jgi:hypothetical protein